MHKKVVLIVMLILLLLSTVALAQDEEGPALFAKGKILSIEALPDDDFEDEYGYEIATFKVELKIVSGPFSGQIVSIEHLITGTPAYDVVVNAGDRVLLAIETVDGELDEVFIADHERDRPLLWLALVFVVFLVGLGGMKGLKSLLSLLLIGVLIVGFFIPLLLRGYSPILLAVAVSAVSTAFTIALVGGVNRKAAAAMIGTVGGVTIAGVLAILVGSMVRASGLAAQEAQMLLFIPQGVDFNFQGLLMAGIIIGALGAVMDVGMSISSAVNEVRMANPELRTKELFWSGMNVGRDIMGTMANTLILAYTGGALSLLLLVRAYEVELIRLFNMDSIASEILRALAGSIGLVAAIPITAAAAAWLQTNRDKKNRPE